MNLTAKEYESLVAKAAPKSKLGINCTKAFISGGAVCVLGELGSQWLMNRGMDQTEALGLVSIGYVLLAAILTGLNVFDDITKFALAGALVPITGFSNSMVAPALEFKSEGYVAGLGAKMFTIAGPVLVFGVSASVVYGIILYLFNLI